MSEQPEPISLDDILITEGLSCRSSRQPDLPAENEALRSLAWQLAHAPDQMLQRLVDLARKLCNADTAGVSLVETQANGEEVFRWGALSGALAAQVGGCVSRHFSPCGEGLERGTPVLFAYPERYFTALQQANLPMPEMLVLPLVVDNQALGTLWLVTHHAQRRFDPEDVRLMTGLTDFAAAALLRNQQYTQELRSTNTRLEAETVDCQQAEAAIAADLRSTRLLHNLTMQVNSGDQEQDLFQHILDTAIALMHADMGSLQILDPERNELYLQSWRGFHPDAAAGWQIVGLDDGSSCGAALKAGERVIVADTETCDFMANTDDLEFYRLCGTRAVQSTPLLDHAGQFIGMISTHWREPHHPDERELRFLDLLARQAADLIEQRQAEAALRKSEARLQSIANLVPDLLWDSEPDGSTNWYNQRWMEYTGQTSEQAIGWGRVDAIHPDDRAGSARRYREAVEQGIPLQQEHRIRPYDGEYRWFVVNASPLKDESGKVIKMYGAATDIHEQRVAREALRESEEKYRALFMSMDEGYAVVEVIADENGEWHDFLFLEVNPAFVEQTGMEYPVGRKATELLGTPNPQWAQVYGQVAETGEPIRFEEGEATLGRVFDLYVFRLGGEGSRRVAVLFTDITERKQQEAALRESEKRLRDVLNSMTEGFALLGSDFTILDVNEETLRLDGRSRDELIGRSHWEAFPGTEDSPVGDIFRHVVQERTSASLEHMYRWPDGRTLWLDMQAYPTQNNGVAIFWRDVTDRKQAEADLQANAERQSFLLQLSDTLQPLADAEAIRYQAARILGQHLKANRVGYAETDDNDETIVVTRNYTDGVPSIEGRYRYDDYGSELLREFKAGRTVVRGDIANDPSLTEAEKEAHAILQLGATVNVPLLKDGRLVAVLFVHFQFAHEWLDSELVLISEVAERVWDAVRRARAEGTLKQMMQNVRTLNTTLEQRTAQLEAINQELDAFSSAVSHDLQTPLRYISSFVERLQAKLQAKQLDPSSLRYLRIIEQAADQAQKMINDLLEFSRMGKTPLHLAPVSMNQLVRQVRSQLAPEIGDRAIKWHIEPLPQVQGDSQMLRLVLQNLLSNAVKYTQNCDPASITIGSETDANEIVFFVEDNGAGFDMKYQNRLFSAFQRLHSEDQFSGTGVGLANVRRIIHRHGGRVWAEGAVDQGATFYFSLPASEVPA